METERFEELVLRALDGLPTEIADRMSNLDVEVHDAPSEAQLRSVGAGPGVTLLGLYQGIPLTGRTSGYQLVPPDRIIIFQRPIERICRSEEELVHRVRDTVVHEIAHHFGISDARLSEIERERRERS